MKRSTQILIAIVAVVAVCSITITSCNKDNKVKDARPTADNLATGVSILALDSSCLTNTGTVSSTGTTSSYTSWTPQYVKLGSGADTVTIVFEGNLVSFIRPVAPNVYIGTISQDSTCVAWTTMAGQVKVRNAFVGVYPTSQPCNVVGLNGTTSTGHNYGLGYYTYSNSTHTYTINRSIVIFRYSGSGVCDNTAATSAATSAAWVLNVSAIISNGTGTAGSVKYRWFKRK